MRFQFVIGLFTLYMVINSHAVSRQGEVKRPLSNDEGKQKQLAVLEEKKILEHLLLKIDSACNLRDSLEEAKPADVKTSLSNDGREQNQRFATDHRKNLTDTLLIAIQDLCETSANLELLTSGEEREQAQQLVEDLAGTFSLYTFKRSTAWDWPDRVVSPLSFFIPMSMLSYGSRGITRSNLLNALGLPKNQTRLARFGYKRLLNKLANCEIHVKTKIFVPSNGVTLKPTFVKLAERMFHAEFETVNVINGFMPSRKINKWVANETNGDVTEVFKPRHINRYPEIVLANTVYFKGIWENGFDGPFTKPRPFHVAQCDNKDITSPVTVLTMYRQGRYQHGRLDDYEASFIEIPYEINSIISEGNTMSMFIILPDKFEGEMWKNLMFKLDPNTLMKRLLSTEERLVELFLPKFRIETELSLNEVLRDEFDFGHRANFSKTFETFEPLHVGEAKSKVVIEIDEEGQQTAESSGIFYKRAESATSSRKTRSEPWLTFRVDHHFLAIVAAKGKTLTPIFTVYVTGCQFLPNNVTTATTSR